MLKKGLLFFILSLLWVLAGQAQTDLIQFSAEPMVVEPGDNVTVSWALSHFRRLDHVTIEMTPLGGTTPAIFANLPPTGTLEITIPADYYDRANLKLYLEKSNGRRYVDARGDIIFREIELEIQDGVEVVRLTAEPNPVERGGTVTVSWEVIGTAPDQTVSLWYMDPSVESYQRTGAYPTSGSATLNIPDYYTETFQVSLWTDRVLSDNNLEIDILCPFDDYIAPICPYTHQERQLMYQYFEHGLLVLDSTNIWAISNGRYGYFFIYEGMASATSTETGNIPAGMFQTAPEFKGLISTGRVSFLGSATSEAQFYTTVIETVPDTFGGHHYGEGLYFYLPDGALIHANPISMEWEYAEE